MLLFLFLLLFLLLFLFLFLLLFLLLIFFFFLAIFAIRPVAFAIPSMARAIRTCGAGMVPMAEGMGSGLGSLLP